MHEELHEFKVSLGSTVNLKAGDPRSLTLQAQQVDAAWPGVDWLGSLCLGGLAAAAQVRFSSSSPIGLVSQGPGMGRPGRHLRPAGSPRARVRLQARTLAPKHQTARVSLHSCTLGWLPLGSGGRVKGERMRSWPRWTPGTGSCAWDAAATSTSPARQFSLPSAGGAASGRRVPLLGESSRLSGS